MKNKNKVLIVAGPTASGKTNFAIKLAKENNGELINADSRQVYKHLNIGTNKGNVTLITNYELQITNSGVGSLELEGRELPLHAIDGVSIHLLSFLDLTEDFSVFDFQRLSYALIDDIISRGKTPIIVGGTGLYLDAVIKGYEFRVTSNGTDWKKRNELSDLDLNELRKKLDTQNPELITLLNNSDRNNKRRLIRLLEKNDVEIQVTSNGSRVLGIQTPETRNFELYYPKYNWDELKSKINHRVEQMFDEGFVDEVKLILEMGYSKDLKVLQTMGYREVIEYLNTIESDKFDESEDDHLWLLNDVKERIKISHRQYAKRQRTWFEGKNRNYKLLITNY